MKKIFLFLFITVIIGTKIFAQASGTITWGKITGVISDSSDVIRTEMIAALAAKLSITDFNTYFDTRLALTNIDSVAKAAISVSATGLSYNNGVVSWGNGYEGFTSALKSSYDDYATTKQATLVSGTNIKTINSNTLLGSGDISIATLIGYTPYDAINFNTDFDTRLGTKSTSNLTEGTNLYYTDARSRAAWAWSGTGFDYSNGVLSYHPGYEGLLSTDKANWNSIFADKSGYDSVKNMWQLNGNTIIPKGSYSIGGGYDQAHTHANKAVLDLITSVPYTKTEVQAKVDSLKSENILEVGTNKPYATIQSAIDASSSGMTIEIEPGTYTESLHSNGKSITLLGHGSIDRIIIQYNAIDSNVVNIDHADSITISNITLKRYAVSGLTGEIISITDANAVLNLDNVKLIGNIHSHTIYSLGKIYAINSDCHTFGTMMLQNTFNWRGYWFQVNRMRGDNLSGNLNVEYFKLPYVSDTTGTEFWDASNFALNADYYNVISSTSLADTIISVGQIAARNTSVLSIIISRDLWCSVRAGETALINVNNSRSTRGFTHFNILDNVANGAEIKINNCDFVFDYNVYDGVHNLEVSNPGGITANNSRFAMMGNSGIYLNNGSPIEITDPNGFVKLYNCHVDDYGDNHYRRIVMVSDGKFIAKNTSFDHYNETGGLLQGGDSTTQFLNAQLNVGTNTYIELVNVSSNIPYKYPISITHNRAISANDTVIVQGFSWRNNKSLSNDFDYNSLPVLIAFSHINSSDAAYEATKDSLFQNDHSKLFTFSQNGYFKDNIYTNGGIFKDSLIVGRKRVATGKIATQSLALRRWGEVSSPDSLQYLDQGYYNLVASVDDIDQGDSVLITLRYKTATNRFLASSADIMLFTTDGFLDSNRAVYSIEFTATYDGRAKCRSFSATRLFAGGDVVHYPADTTINYFASTFKEFQIIVPAPTANNNNIYYLGATNCNNIESITMTVVK